MGEIHIPEQRDAGVLQRLEALWDGLARRPEATALPDDELIEAVLTLHNVERLKNGAGKLVLNAKLTVAARRHAEDMLRQGYFSHDSLDGRTAGQRIKAAGYVWRTYGENIAWGSGRRGSPPNIMQLWMSSPGHKRNILNPKFQEIGIGIAHGTYKGTNDVRMYCVDFGKR